jgi:hypothetical protein
MHDQPEATEEEHEQGPARLEEEEAMRGGEAPESQQPEDGDG